MLGGRDPTLDRDPQLARVVDIMPAGRLELVQLVDDLGDVWLEASSDVAQRGEVAVRARPLATEAERGDRMDGVLSIGSHAPIDCIIGTLGHSLTRDRRAATAQHELLNFSCRSFR